VEAVRFGRCTSRYASEVEVLHDFDSAYGGGIESKGLSRVLSDCLSRRMRGRADEDIECCLLSFH
jgi:hypothetical protein